MTSEYLPNGDVVVTIGDELVWTPLDVFTWVAFGERRGRATLPKIIFPPNEWSHDWAHWPPQNMLAALNEIRSGVAWKPPPGSHDAAFADADREWARSMIERTGCDAHTLAEALASDIRRAERAVDCYHNAREEVMSAVRQGRLQVWGCRALAFGKPDHAALPEPLSPRLFTHDAREVNEGAWVWMAGERDDGPWWDRVRFDKDKVLALWPMRGDAGNVSDCVLLNEQIKQTSYTAPVNLLYEPKKRKHTGHDYRVSDALLVCEMRKLILANPELSARSAANEFADRAEGKNSTSHASKIARLVKRYSEKYPFV